MVRNSQIVKNVPYAPKNINYAYPLHCNFSHTSCQAPHIKGVYMNKYVIVFIILLLAARAQARGIKDISAELKQTKSTATAQALIESIAETTPQTDEDVAALGQLMDKYPTQGQKALAGIKDPKLAKAVMSECDRQATKMKAIRAKGKDTLDTTTRQEYLNAYMNSAAAIGALTNMKNKDAVPLLRGYLQDEDLSRLASEALGRLGDTESMENMLGNIEQRKNIDLSAYGDKGMVRIVEEINKPGIEPKRKYALIAQIKGSKSPERKRLLKDLALNHPDGGVRDQAGQALLNSIVVNPETADNPYIADWATKTKNTDSGYWAVSAISISHDYGDKPLEDDLAKVLIDVLKTSTEWVNRQEAARALGIFRVKDSLPVLVECSQKDSNSSTRGACQFSYWKITGEILPTMFNPKDIKEFNEHFSSPGYINYRATARDSEDKKYMETLESAFNKYKELHK